MTHPPRPAPAAGDRLLKFLAIAWLGLGGACPAGCGSSEAPAVREPSVPGAKPTLREEEGPVVEESTVTADRVLRNMVTAYKKARSYADRGTVRLVADRTPEAVDETLSFSLALRRPNKIRMEVYQARVVCDGKTLHAAILDLRDQVVAREAPAELTMRSIYSDRLLASVLINGGFAGPSPQLNLLLGEAPMKELLEHARKTTLDKPESIDGRDCYRVRIEGPEGTFVFWIDRETFLLRRINYPTDDLREMLARGGTVESVSLVAEFTGAQLDGRIDPKAFQFEVPEGAEVFKWFRPPHPAQLLGKQVPEFKFFDLAGKPVTPALLAGQVVVLNFWAAGWKPCLDNLPKLDKVRRQYQGNDKIAWLAVSVNDPEMENQTLQDALVRLGVRLPVLRDSTGNQGRVFNTVAVPSTFLIDSGGVVQDFELGDNPKLATELPEKLDKLLAGEDIYQAPLEAHRKQREADEQAMEAVAKGQPPEGAGDQQTIPVPRAEIAGRSQPKTFRLTPLWKCPELAAPSNVLVVPSADGPPRLLVVDGWKSVAEVGIDGKLVAKHALKIEPSEYVNVLRTATGSDGKRYFVALALFTGQQRCHLLDEDLQVLLSYPQDALEHPHPGIADVHLADLEGDGTLELYAGYWGLLGVKAASLQGKPLWSNRTSVINVQRIAVSGPDQQGRRKLLCANTSDRLVVIDATGRSPGNVTVPGRFLRNLASADLDGDGRPEWCGLAGVKMGDNVAVGLDLSGKELWSYTLPEGVHQQPIERLIAGRLSGDGPGRWLLPAPDGSIHILAADGKLLDRFNYGAILAGLATTEIDGKPVLIVASSEGLEALNVE